MNTRAISRRRSRLAVEDLETRNLLSSATLNHPISTAVMVSSHSPSLLSQLPATPQQTVSSIPSNGDLNPYGVAYVPTNFPENGVLKAGDLLVSNFNASGNLQGTGSTISKISPNGKVSTFFQGPTGLGLTTALGVLSRGFVIVGTLPTTDGTSATIGKGSLLIIDRFGHQVASIAEDAGPWDLTVADYGRHASIFVSSVLNGTITRFDLSVTDHSSQVRVTGIHTIASGYSHRTDPAALVVGPTGLAYNAKTDTLYVASTGDNAIYAVPNALKSRKDSGTGAAIYSDTTHLHGPLGLAIVPNGHLIIANGDVLNADPDQPSELVEITTKGRFINQLSISADQAAPFGFAGGAFHGIYYLAAVNDVTNQVQIYSVKIPRRR